MVGKSKTIGVIFVLTLVLQAGCSFTSREIKDSAPAQPVDVSLVPDAVPRAEIRGEAGNKSPYTVLGKTYWVLPDSAGYTAEGIASWYGTKFHGRQTSNGEVYSMYGMTAAHKTLPIPCYVRVTNISNGREVVVRVNDRGPFHDDRLIDLTYAAASKLGFLEYGTAPVKLEVLTPKAASAAGAVARGAGDSTAPALMAAENAAGSQLPENTFLQAGAYSTPSAAERARQRIAGLTTLPVFVAKPRRDRLYRVRIGPIASNLAMMDVRQQLQLNQLPAPHVVYD